MTEFRYLRIGAAAILLAVLIIFIYAFSGDVFRFNIQQMRSPIPIVAMATVTPTVSAQFAKSDTSKATPAPDGAGFSAFFYMIIWVRGLQAAAWIATVVAFLCTIAALSREDT